MKVCIFDTPGFGDSKMSNVEISMMMRKKTDHEVHLLLYCISLVLV